MEEELVTEEAMDALREERIKTIANRVLEELNRDDREYEVKLLEDEDRDTIFIFWEHRQIGCISFDRGYNDLIDLNKAQFKVDRQEPIGIALPSQKQIESYCYIMDLLMQKEIESWS